MEALERDDCGGGVASEAVAAAYWDWTARARSIRVPMKTFVKPLSVVMTDGGTDWERVWLVI